MKYPTEPQMQAQRACKFVPALSSVFCPRVIDGDSIECYAYCDARKKLFKFNVRVRGVDTPEMRGKSALEKAAARSAKAFTESQALGMRLELENVSHDKYGRILADVRVPSGELLHELLLKSGHGVAYFGGKKAVFQVAQQATTST